MRTRLTVLVLLALLACVGLYVYPAIDLQVASLFFNNGAFPWRAAILPNFFHDIVQPLSLMLGGLFFALTLWHLYKKSGWRRWAFLLLSLIIGPGLITNTLLKDNWGRARPVQVEQFGGDAQFTPPFVMSDQCDHNCSFVAGDPAFGFWLHSFGYIAPQRRRRLFVAGLGAGVFYGVLRVGMGAHFFSDVIVSGLLMLASSAALFGLMFGRRALVISWTEWLGLKSSPKAC